MRGPPRSLQRPYAAGWKGDQRRINALAVGPGGRVISMMSGRSVVSADSPP